MATRFELVLHGKNPVGLRAAGEEALDEIDRLEAQLSLFRPSSEIAHVNARAAREPVRVTPQVFELLQRARKLHEETQGAFDITIAPLMRCWGFQGGKGRMPNDADVAQALKRVGMHLVALDPTDYTVRFLREGVMLDLGAIGKGYAIERAAELLLEAGVTSALLHGGTSTIYALGQPPESSAWQIAVTSPENETAAAGKSGTEQKEYARVPAAVVALKDEAMSVSAVWGKCFAKDEEIYGHILDPRTGRPACKAVLALVVLKSATETDALSTALLTVGAEGHEAIANLRAGMKTLVIAKEGKQFMWQGRGIEPFGEMKQGYCDLSQKPV